MIYIHGNKNFTFLINAINKCYSGIKIDKILTKDTKNVDDEEINSIQNASLIVPVIHPTNLENIALPRKSFLQAINQGRCNLIFDFSNEAGTPGILEKIKEILLQNHITGNCWFVCQNRSLVDSHKNDLFNIIVFDYFVVMGNLASVESVKLAGAETFINAIHENLKPFQICCLNATPRIHRVHTVLEIMHQGLLDLSNTSQSSFPFISLPKLDNYSKGKPLNKEEIMCSINKKPHLVPYVSNLLDALPLVADTFVEQGNGLAFKIDFNHYLKSNISIVTETCLSSNIIRITEKTIKALAHGHPFVIIGPKNSVRVVRELGFSAMDYFIDHSYDTIDDPEKRISKAIFSAKQFLEKLKNKNIDTKKLSEQARYNIEWSSKGFGEFYWKKFVVPILNILHVAPEE